MHGFLPCDHLIKAVSMKKLLFFIALLGFLSASAQPGDDQYLREAKRLLKKTPVIVTTADERQAEELEHKADLVLLKPVSLNQLRELANRMANSAN